MIILHFELHQSVNQNKGGALDILPLRRSDSLPNYLGNNIRHQSQQHVPSHVTLSRQPTRPGIILSPCGKRFQGSWIHKQDQFTFSILDDTHHCCFTRFNVSFVELITQWKHEIIKTYEQKQEEIYVLYYKSLGNITLCLLFDCTIETLVYYFWFVPESHVLRKS